MCREKNEFRARSARRLENKNLRISVAVNLYFSFYLFFLAPLVASLCSDSVGAPVNVS